MEPWMSLLCRGMLVLVPVIVDIVIVIVVVNTEVT